jgi:hypothetical protein
VLGKVQRRLEAAPALRSAVAFVMLSETVRVSV